MSSLKQCQDYFADQIFSETPKPQNHLNEKALQNLNTYPDYKQSLYRNLVGNTITSMIETSFELTLDYLGKDISQKLFRQFLQNHKPRSAFFRDISQDFIDFCQNTNAIQDPIALDLFQYETAHYHLRFAKNTKPQHQNQMQKNLLNCKMELNPHLIVLHLTYPVHSNRQFNNLQANPKTVLLRRHPQTFDVDTFNISNIAEHFIKTLQNKSEVTLQTVLEQLINSFNSIPAEQVQAEATGFLKQALEEKFILTLY